MARHLRIEFPGAIYHTTSRMLGDARSLLFRDDADRVTFLGKRKAFEFVEYGPTLAEMKGKKSDRQKHYRQFVETGLAEDDEEFKEALKESARSIGSDGFRAWVDDLYQDLAAGHNAPEDASFRHITEPLVVEEILRVLADMFSVER